MLKRQGSRHYFGLSSSSRNFTSGDNVEGMVVLETDTPLSLESMSVVLKCEEYAAVLSNIIKEDIREQNYRASIWNPKWCGPDKRGTTRDGVRRDRELHFERKFDIINKSGNRTLGKGVHSVPFKLRIPEDIPDIPSSVALTTIGVLGTVWKLEFYTGPGAKPHDQVINILPPTPKSEVETTYCDSVEIKVPSGKSSSPFSQATSAISGIFVGKSDVIKVTTEFRSLEQGYPVDSACRLFICIRADRDQCVQVKRLQILASSCRTSTIGRTTQVLKEMECILLDHRPKNLVLEEKMLELGERVNLYRDWFSKMPPTVHTWMSSVEHELTLIISLVPILRPSASSVSIELKVPIKLRGPIIYK